MERMTFWWILITSAQRCGCHSGFDPYQEVLQSATRERNQRVGGEAGESRGGAGPGWLLSLGVLAIQARAGASVSGALLCCRGLTSLVMLVDWELIIVSRHIWSHQRG